MNDATELEGRELVAESSTVELLNRGEIDMQIATAHRFPRNVKTFRDDVLSLATLTEETAEECSYALPRKEANGQTKTIIGPSARFAEIVASSWGNCRAGARVVDDRGTFVVAQGVFMDLQRNTAITFEVQRRIVDKHGRRFKDDMVGVTANAACSIALRNAVLKGVPKALWSDLWARARQVAVGDVKTLSNRRSTVVSKLAHYGVSEAMILAKLGRASVADVTVEDLEVLIGLGTSLKDGETTVEEAFGVEAAEAPKTGADALRAAMGKAANQAKPTGPTFAELAERIAKADTEDDLNVCLDLAASSGLPDDQREELAKAIEYASKTLHDRLAKSAKPAK